MACVERTLLSAAFDLDLDSDLAFDRLTFDFDVGAPFLARLLREKWGFSHPQRMPVFQITKLQNYPITKSP
jgi:hypothetical protein